MPQFVLSSFVIAEEGDSQAQCDAHAFGPSSGGLVVCEVASPITTR